MNSNSGQGRTETRKRRSRGFVVMIVAVLAVTFLVTTWFAFVTFKVIHPTQATERHADVIVSLAPGHHRLPTALDLYDRGLGDELAISWFPAALADEDSTFSLHSDAELMCEDARAISIHCFTPAESTTRGEAIAVAQLMQDNGWTSVTVVTSQYHAFRTKYIFEKHLPVGTDVEVVPVPIELSTQAWIYRIAYENAAFLKALWTSAPEA